MKFLSLVLLLWITGINLADIDKDAFLLEVNKIRQEGCMCGDVYYKSAQVVVWNSTLAKTSYLHSKDMAANNYFSHVSKSGQTPIDRLKKQKYHYKSFAENIFRAIDYTPEPKEVVMAWKNSPTHCVNMMNPDYVEMGVGEYKGYYTQLFGKR